STPCSVPSSPGRPCNMFNAMSGLTVVSTAAMSRPTSIRVTRWPSRASASAQALPERNDISRSADQPPISTATCLLIFPRSRPQRVSGYSNQQNRGGLALTPPAPPSLSPGERMLCHSDPLDLPFEIDAGVFFDPPTHRLAQDLDVGSGGTAEVDQKIAVHRRHLRIRNLKATAPGGIDESPRLVTGRVLESRAAGAALNRLGCLARFRDLLHLGGNVGWIAGGAWK